MSSNKQHLVLSFTTSCEHLTRQFKFTFVNKHTIIVGTFSYINENVIIQENKENEHG